MTSLPGKPSGPGPGTRQQRAAELRAEAELTVKRRAEEYQEASTGDREI